MFQVLYRVSQQSYSIYYHFPPPGHPLGLGMHRGGFNLGRVDQGKRTTQALAVGPGHPGSVVKKNMDPMTCVPVGPMGKGTAQTYIPN